MDVSYQNKLLGKKRYLLIAFKDEKVYKIKIKKTYAKI